MIRIDVPVDQSADPYGFAASAHGRERNIAGDRKNLPRESALPSRPPSAPTTP